MSMTWFLGLHHWTADEWSNFVCFTDVLLFFCVFTADRRLRVVRGALRRRNDDLRFRSDLRVAARRLVVLYRA